MKILVLDVEGTLFEAISLPVTTVQSTIWQGIAKALGPQAEIEEARTHEIHESKGYKNYLQWMEATIEIHKKYGLSASTFCNLVRSAVYNPNVVSTLSRVDRRKYEPVLISGGFKELAARAQKDLAIRHAFAACEYFFDERGTLCGYNLLPCDFDGKIDFIKLMLREYRLNENDWVFVGDGKNDVPIARAAPLSVAYRADEMLNDVSTHRIQDFAELTAILNSNP